MKKIQLFLSTLIIVTSSIAQEVERINTNFVQTSKKKVIPILKASAISSLAQDVELTKNNFVIKTNKNSTTTPSAEKSIPIWSDDFSDASTWSLGHAFSCDLDWQIGQNLAPTGAYAIPVINSTTAANGFAMLDSDAYGAANPGDVESSWMTSASPINLSGNTSILLSFETNYRQYDTQCFIVTSTNNNDWPELTASFDASTNPNVYAVFEDLENTDYSESNPTTVGLNISSSVGGASQVWVRFHHTGQEGYSWFVDDVTIVELQSDDLVLNSAWFSPTSGIEYGRTPEAHLVDTFLLGTQVLNFGKNTQENVTYNMNVTSASGTSLISETTTTASLASDSSDVQEYQFTGLNLTEGKYILTSEVSSDVDNSTGESFADNSYTRDFEVTNNLFSIDGIGVYSDTISKMNYLGTNYGNGTVVMVRYELLVPTTVVGLEIGIHELSRVGGTIIPFLSSEATVFADDMSIDRIAENLDGIVVTQAHVDNNLVYIELEPTVLDPGVYYACAELFEASGENQFVLLQDDETVAQPSSASMINSLDDNNAPTTYSNGTASAVRLAIGDYVDLDENENNTLFSVVPNPSNGVFTVTTDKNDFYTLDVINILGEVISSKTIEGAINETIDISNFDAGIYLVKVSTSTSQNVQKVVVK